MNDVQASRAASRARHPSTLGSATTSGLHDVTECLQALADELKMAEARRAWRRQNVHAASTPPGRAADVIDLNALRSRPASTTRRRS